MSVYPGPVPFEREQKTYFFGRGREIQDIGNLLLASDAVLLYARSGAGKSSLVNAGLVPFLEREGCSWTLARIGEALREEAQRVAAPNIFSYQVLAGCVESQPLEGSPKHTSLRERFSRPVEGECHVLILDQFEEVFASFPDRWRDREGFFCELAEALAANPKLRTLLVLREEYLASLNDYARLLPDQLGIRYHLERLTPARAKEAIERPMALTGRTFHPTATEALIDDLGKIAVHRREGTQLVPGEFVEPVYLQVVCHRLEEQLDKDPEVREITTDHLRGLGDPEQALSEFYEGGIHDVVRRCGTREALLRRWFEQHLITAGATRGSVFQGEKQTGGIDNVVVSELQKARLVRTETRAGALWVELAHDRLIQPVRTANAKWRNQRYRRIVRYLGLGLPMVLAALFYFWFLPAGAVSDLKTTVDIPTAFRAYTKLRSFLLQEGRANRLYGGFWDKRGRQAAAAEEWEQAILSLAKAITLDDQSERRWVLDQLTPPHGLPLEMTCWTHERFVALASLENPGEFRTVSEDGSVHRWHGCIARREAQLPAPMSHSSGVALSSTGSRFLYWDGTRTLLGKLGSDRIVPLKYPACGGAFTAGGTLAATRAPNGRVHLWDAETGELRRTLDGASTSGGCNVAVNRDATIVLLDRQKGREVELWRTDGGGGPSRAVTAIQGPVKGFALSGDGATAIALDLKGRLLIGPANDPQLQDSPLGGPVELMAYQPITNTLLTHDSEGRLQKWSAVPIGAAIPPIPISPVSMRLKRDGRTLVALLGTGAVRIGDVAELRPEARAAKMLVDKRIGDLSPEGDVLVVKEGQTWSLWRDDATRIAELAPVPELHDFSPEGDHIAVTQMAEGQTVVRILNLRSGEPVASIPLTEGAKRLALGPAGTYFAVVLESNGLQVYSVAKRQPVSPRISVGPINHLAFHPTENLLLIGSGDRSGEAAFRLWRFTSRDPPYTAEQEWPVDQTGFSPDGRYFLIQTRDGYASVLDTDRRSQVLRIGSKLRSPTCFLDRDRLMRATDQALHIYDLRRDRRGPWAAIALPARWTAVWRLLPDQPDTLRTILGARNGQILVYDIDLAVAIPKVQPADARELLRSWEQRLGLRFEKDEQIVRYLAVIEMSDGSH